MREYVCLEYGCEATLRGKDDAELIACVLAHLAEEHASYELEDVILAGATGSAESEEPPTKLS